MHVKASILFAAPISMTLYIFGFDTSAEEDIVLQEPYHQSTDQPISSDIIYDIDVSIDNVDLDKDLVLIHHQFEDVTYDFDELKNALSDIESRLDDLEGGGNYMPGQEIENELIMMSSPEMIPESKVSTWIDDNLAYYYVDDEKTNTARHQVEQSLEYLPGALLDDIQCNAEFCRATFSKNGSIMPDVTDLMGYPPFLNEGFTMENADGTVELYFAEIGASMGDIKQQISDESLGIF